ncbi:anthrone oxygenase family protein [Streptomyces sp. NPDC059957]|uniref:anthrone oxygenase family protein n=1 Tax=unclassified Streptomyces TaxID=2593676 RepID=UPI00364F5D2E
MSGFGFRTYGGTADGIAALAAAFVEARAGRRAVALWAAVAAAAYLVVLVVTFAVNIPLNNLGDAAKSADFSVVEEFKGIWETANIVRTLLCAAALTALARALVLYGRATGTTGTAARG